MKTPRLLIATLLLATAAPLLAVSQPLLKAEVTGTVQTQIILSATSGRIHTEPLNTKRIFEEFQVSKAAYELVFDISNGGLVLVPKHTSANLPTLPVVVLGTGSEIVDTKARIIQLTITLGTTNATNLFKNATGELAGAVHYTGSINALVFTKFVCRVVGSGTDTSGGGNGEASLKFKVTTNGIFNQVP